MNSISQFPLLLALLGVLFHECVSFGNYESYALMTFKEAIYEDPKMVTSTWNVLDVDPCDWSGIGCSADRQHVIKINISSSSLKGFLTPDLALLTQLQELVLHDNALLGVIPKELGMLSNLKVLDLGKNRLSGPIPPEIGKLTNLVKINLRCNGLTGKLPPELGNLKYLQELKVDRNRLQGTVPAEGSSDFTSSMHGMYTSGSNLSGICRLSQLKVADFSYNFFAGSVPKCLESFPRVSFQGNCLQNKDIQQRTSGQCGGASPPPKPHSTSASKHNTAENGNKHDSEPKPVWLLALEIVTGVMFGSLILVGLVTAFQRFNGKSSIIMPWRKSSSGKGHATLYLDSELLKDVKKYSRQELEVACEDFSNIIGSSPDSVVYKGIIKGGPEIAVISLCIKEENWTGYLELYYQREVAELARLTNDNTGKLLGYCSESAPFTRMLVFEYASNGTLYEHLHYGEGCQMSWTRRMKIVLGIAQGLKYLHTELNPPFTISELNSSAVYLTEDFLPKLVDFESWKNILSRSEKHSGSISSQGDVCVLSISIERRHEDVLGNIYAFGVLLLEIVSGRPPISKDKGDLVNWAKDYLELPEAMSYVVDPELKHFNYDELKAICEVASLCLDPNPTNRPSMTDISSILDGKIDTSMSAELRSSSLAWAELALST